MSEAADELFLMTNLFPDEIGEEDLLPAYRARLAKFLAEKEKERPEET
jgi:hypothetical protein